MVTPDTKAEFGAAKQSDEMIIRISEGDHFGQEAVLSGDLRKDTAISDGYSWLFVLSKREMGRIVEDNIEAADLLQQLLRFDPEKRISAEDALKHEYLKQFHFEEVERNAPCKVNIHPPDYEKKSTAHYRERLYKEVTKIRNDDKKRDEQVLQENRGVGGGMPRRR